MYYTLPSASTYKCFDRFSICPDLAEDEDGKVPFWPLFHHLLSREVASAAQLVDVLETISYTLRNECNSDYGLLEDLLRNHPRFWVDCWPGMKKVALRMPFFFPSGNLPVLGRSVDTIEFSRPQTACLVVHQFLCTLSTPVWRPSGVDFSIWFSSRQRHPTAARFYLDNLLSYFEALISSQHFLDGTTNQWPVQYVMQTGPTETFELQHDIQLSEMVVELVDRHSTSAKTLGVPDGAFVISANKSIGFGQSATQEEVHVGISPETSPAVLFTPPLLDNQALKMTGAQAFSDICGTGRDITKKRMETTDDGNFIEWQHRTMLFMDALEIDMMLDEERLADLASANIDREITKALSAFTLPPGGRQYRGGIFTGLWGCGAFFGDPGVKMLCLWCAASAANQKLTIICDTDQHGFALQLRQFIHSATNSGLTAKDIRDLLQSAPHNLRRHETLPWFLNHV